MIVDWQREPINDQLIHIDLKRIAMDKVLRVKVRVKLLGIPWVSRIPAAFWTRYCAKWRSSACLRTFPATSTWMSAIWPFTHLSGSQRPEEPHSGSIQVPQCQKDG